MRVLFILSNVLLFSCAGPQNILTDELNPTNSTLDISSIDTYNSSVTDLTTEIRKIPTLNIRGIGPRASVYFKNPRRKPMFLLNGEIIPDYYTLYTAVSNQIIKLVKVIPPRQAAIYGLRASSGVILITTDNDLSLGD